MLPRQPQRLPAVVVVVSLEMHSDARVVLISVSLSYMYFPILLFTNFFQSGLPAFKPGEKVEINLGMDDI